MGDVGSAIATPFVAVGTAVTGQANKKIYYDCPRCGQEVWVYAAAGAFSGRKCLDCRGKTGPVDMGIVGDAIDVAITPVTATFAAVTGNADEKIWYNCPKCKERKWVSAMTPQYVNRICLACKPLGDRAVENVHPMGQFATVNKIEKDSAKYQGSVIYQQWGEDSNKDYSYNIDLNDKISWYETHYCRILHGSCSWAANGIVQGATFGKADLIDHWWLVIKTTKGNYYQLQFRAKGATFSNDNGLIELRKCGSIYDCNQTGLAEGGKEPDADIFNNSSYSYTFSNPCYTINGVIAWMKSNQFSAKWKVGTHNCQDLCREFYKKF